MEKVNDISILIVLLPQYRSVNTLYREIIKKSALSFDTQCYITDFYNEFKDTQVFEKSILNLLLSTDKEKLTQIISNLKTEISKNIDLYITEKDFLDGIDIVRVCTNRHNPPRIEIEGRLKRTNELWQELTQVRNSLESANWKNDKIAEERLTKEEERLKGIYKGEQEKLQSLYQQEKESDKHASKYTENVFGKIYELGRSFIFLLDNYFPIETEDIPTTESIVVEKEATISELEQQTEIEPDMIFRTRMFEKFLALEQKLIADKYLNTELHWISLHETGKPDIKRLITFLVGLLDNDYFLPGRDKNTKIKKFFESRYNIEIGQNFEPARRKRYINEYSIVFYDYQF